MTGISSTLAESPPRVPAAFRVGVVGHRTNRLPDDPVALDALQRQLTRILQAVRTSVETFARRNDTFYASGPARLVAISSLAEGTDRIFAGAALGLGYALCTPLPFFQAEFETDFGAPEGASVREFRELLARAETRFELDGKRSNAPAAYAAAARIVLNQSDLLVAVWDGLEARGQGGTAETVREAVRYNVPVLWVTASAPFNWKLVRTISDLRPQIGSPLGDDLDRTAAGLIEQELRLPEAGAPAGDSVAIQGHASLDPGTMAAAYFAERRPSPWRHLFWKSFRNLIGGGGSILPHPRAQDFVAAALSDEGGKGDAELITHFAWADRLADYYADAHRSNVVLASVLSVTAVLLGILPTVLRLDVGLDRVRILLITVLEFGIVVALSGSFRRGQRRRWHEKWLEYRMLAEWIRQLRFLAPLGGGRPLLRSRAHLAVYGEPLRSWMYWHVRAIARARALPSAIADRTHVLRCLDGIIATIGDATSGQIGFHDATMRRSETIRERLHRGSSVLVRLVMVAIALHLILLMAHVEPPEPIHALFEAAVLLCAAFIPALVAALANINNQGEFARLAKRARAMRDTLHRIGQEAARMRADDADVTLARVSALANRMAATMLEEVIDWRVVVVDLPQGLE